MLLFVFMQHIDWVLADKLADLLMTILQVLLAAISVVVLSRQNLQNRNMWATIFVVCIIGFGAIKLFINNQINTDNRNKEIASKFREDSLQKSVNSIDAFLKNIGYEKRGNTYTKTSVTNNYFGAIKQRHVTAELINRITTILPQKNTYIMLMNAATDKETFVLTTEISNKLKELGYQYCDVNGPEMQFLKNLSDTVTVETEENEYHPHGRVIVYPQTNTYSN